MGKISPSYLLRLHQLIPDVKSRAIILLNSKDERHNSALRVRDRHEIRRDFSKRFSIDLEESFAEIKYLLEAHGGKLISSRPSHLGTVVVEGPPSAIFALSESRKVRSIIEDQTVHPNRGTEGVNIGIR